MSLKDTLRTMWFRFARRASLSADTAPEATIEGIKNEVELQGTNLWVLAFAIIIASVGLNVNSTAVIIGAMLISPLMGPICGLGLAVGILDMDLFKKSVKNLIIMVAISLLASTLYFVISPLNDAQSELLARTRPTIYDVLIAFFGGLTGIVAKSRKEQAIVTISGVAIATALMPPLCTAGYGLATMQWNYFYGAFYLFFINSFFIATATFIMVRFLNFPMTKDPDTSRGRHAKLMLYFFAIIVMVPSIITAVNVIRESAFNSSAVKYANSIQDNEFFKEQELLKYDKVFDNDSSVISLTFVGKNLSSTQYDYLHKHLADYSLERTHLEIKELNGNPIDWDKQNDLWVNMLDRKERQIRQQDSTISVLKQQLAILEEGKDGMYGQLFEEIKITYPELSGIGFSTDYCKTCDKMSYPVVYLHWSEQPAEPTEQRLVEWLKLRLAQPELDYRSVVEKVRE